MTINVPCLTDTDYAVMAGDYEANPPGADEVSSVDGPPPERVTCQRGHDLR